MDEDEEEASCPPSLFRCRLETQLWKHLLIIGKQLAWNLVRIIRHNYELICVCVQMMWTFILRGSSDSSAVWEAASPSRWHSFPYSRVLVSVKAFYVWHKSAHKAKKKRNCFSDTHLSTQNASRARIVENKSSDVDFFFPSIIKAFNIWLQSCLLWQM